MWWDAKTWKVRKVVPVLEDVEAAGFIESGRLSYTGGANGNIRIWQTDNGREVRIIGERKFPILDSFLS
jgi:U3 small nucleolar RNA-associated protein 13